MRTFLDFLIATKGQVWSPEEIDAMLRQHNPALADQRKADLAKRAQERGTQPTVVHQEPPALPPYDPTPPRSSKHKAVVFHADSDQAKIMKVFTQLNNIDPQRAKFFIELVSKPGRRAEQIKRYAFKLPTLEFLKVIAQLQQQG